MIAFAGILHDGRTTLSVPVQVEADENAMVIADVSATARLPRSAVVADAPIPGVPRTLRLPGGESIETADHDAVAALWPERGLVARTAFALESRSWVSMAGILVTAACGWLVVTVLLPLAAEPVARRVSPNVERYLGEQVLASLDRAFLKPSRLPEEEQDEWGDKFAAFTAGETGEEHFELAFRHAGIPNAFALPGGTIIVTDEMVGAVKSDDELYAVLAHEIGHVRGHHAMRLVLQDSGLAVLVTALAGDAVGVTILAAALPSVLLQSRYSREFETEADDYALAHLKRHGISPQAFTVLMRRLEMEDKSGPGSDNPVFRYLGSHPATEERIRRAEEAR